MDMISCETVDDFRSYFHQNDPLFKSLLKCELPTKKINGNVDTSFDSPNAPIFHSYNKQFCDKIFDDILKELRDARVDNSTADSAKASIKPKNQLTNNSKNLIPLVAAPEPPQIKSPTIVQQMPPEIADININLTLRLGRKIVCRMCNQVHGNKLHKNKYTNNGICCICRKQLEEQYELYKHHEDYAAKNKCCICEKTFTENVWLNHIQECLKKKK